MNVGTDHGQLLLRRGLARGLQSDHDALAVCVGRRVRFVKGRMGGRMRETSKQRTTPHIIRQHTHSRALNRLLGQPDDVGDLGGHGDVPEEAQVRGPELGGEELWESWGEIGASVGWWCYRERSVACLP